MKNNAMLPCHLNFCIRELQVGAAHDNGKLPSGGLTQMVKYWAKNGRQILYRAGKMIRFDQI
jgi:hypothetical protein